MSGRFDHDLDRTLCAVSQEERVDPNLLRALSLVETNGHRWRVRYERNFTHLFSPEKFAKELGISLATEEVLQQISWGPMQIMGAVARENGFTDHLTKLTDAGLAYRWSVVHLKKLLQKYGSNERDAIAAWNWGHARKTSTGSYPNQKYVDAVCEHLSRLRQPASPPSSSKPQVS